MFSIIIHQQQHRHQKYANPFSSVATRPVRFRHRVGSHQNSIRMWTVRGSPRPSRAKSSQDKSQDHQRDSQEKGRNAWWGEPHTFHSSKKFKLKLIISIMHVKRRKWRWNWTKPRNDFNSWCSCTISSTRMVSSPWRSIVGLYTSRRDNTSMGNYLHIN